MLSCNTMSFPAFVITCLFLQFSSKKVFLGVTVYVKFNSTYNYQYCGPGSSVGIVTDYGLDGPGSNPGGGEIFRTCPDQPWGPPGLL
jgi:hypothetical protein